MCVVLVSLQLKGCKFDPGSRQLDVRTSNILVNLSGSIYGLTEPAW